MTKRAISEGVSVTRDTEVERRRIIRAAFREIITEQNVSAAEARQLMEDAIVGRNEEPKLVAIDPEIKLCQKCGKPDPRLPENGKCWRCRTGVGQCADCGKDISPKATRCNPCAQRNMRTNKRNIGFAQW